MPQRQRFRGVWPFWQLWRIDAYPARSDSSVQNSPASAAPSFNSSPSIYHTYPNQQVTQAQQTVQPQSQPQNSTAVHEEGSASSSSSVSAASSVSPYIPTVQPIKTEQGQQAYLLPADEIQKILQRNANIIRKVIDDVHQGSNLCLFPLMAQKKSTLPNTRVSTQVFTF